MIYQSYSAMRKAIFFFIGIKFCKMETTIFPEKLNFHELMIEIFLDYRHIQLHNKAFAKIYVYIPAISVGLYLLQTMCFSRDNSSLKIKISDVIQPGQKTATDKFIDLQ